MQIAPLPFSPAVCLPSGVQRPPSVRPSDHRDISPPPSLLGNVQKARKRRRLSSSSSFYNQTLAALHDKKYFFPGG